MELVPEHFGHEIPCPHCGDSFRPSEAVLFPDPRAATITAPKVSVEGRAYPCPRCGNYMDLLPEHAGIEIPCPHCGAHFVPGEGNATPSRRPVRASAPRSSRSAPAATSGSRNALYLGIVGLVGGAVSFACCGPIGLPLMLCGPIGLWMALRERAAVRRKREEPHRDLSSALVVTLIATILFVLMLLGWAFIFLIGSGSLSLRSW